jgi:hypothetical protein
VIYESTEAAHLQSSRLLRLEVSNLYISLSIFWIAIIMAFPFTQKMIGGEQPRLIHKSPNRLM